MHPRCRLHFLNLSWALWEYHNRIGADHLPRRANVIDLTGSCGQFVVAAALTLDFHCGIQLEYSRNDRIVAERMIETAQSLSKKRLREFRSHMKMRLGMRKTAFDESIMKPAHIRCDFCAALESSWNETDDYNRPAWWDADLIFIDASRLESTRTQEEGEEAHGLMVEEEFAAASEWLKEGAHKKHSTILFSRSRRSIVRIIVRSTGVLARSTSKAKRDFHFFWQSYLNTEWHRQISVRFNC